MPTTILLVRHGQTDWNAQQRWQGHLDIPLNETGQRQADALARRLQSWPIQAVYASDLQRAAMTAVSIATPHTLHPIFDPQWRERDVGDFAGLTKEEIRKQYPDIWENMRQGLLAPPNGEDWRALRRRAVAAFEQVVCNHNGGMVVVVSHGGLLSNVVAHVLEIPEDRHGRFRLSGNTSHSIVEITETHGPRLILLNDTSHLENSTPPFP